jgi:signal transduction histidine kinase
VARPVTVPLLVVGDERWASVSAVAFPDGTVYALRDMTAEHELERTRSDFVATASHELRTPLAAVYGAARTLRRHGSLDEEEQRAFLEIVETESERLAQIVNQMLLAGQLGAGDVQVVAEACDAGEVVRGVVESAALRAPEAISLRVTGGDGLPLVSCDRNKLRQVLVNLVENAVKYSPDGGPVEVRVSRGDRGVLWAVSDRGLGIPPSERRRVFEKFYRLDPNMTRGIGGTGLGLYICRELVRRLDGRIWVEDNPQGGNGEARGSTFFVEIPVAERPARAKAPEKTAA